MISHNLPIQLSSFIGRTRELGEVMQLLTSSRLVTLTGAGGCGKTRLALQVAADLKGFENPSGLVFTGGIRLVALASLSDPALVPQQVATVLDVREQPNQPLLTTLTNYLRDKIVLLILDNCEHLIEACAQLVELLLQTCPSLTILATSREALNIEGETLYPVPPLQIPNPKSQTPTTALAQVDAVQLFVARAHAANPSFALTDKNASAIAQICQRLDGIPLAIELAAARVKVLSVEQIAAHLDDSLSLLTGGKRTALPRHQTMRATLDWSYELLTESERTLFRRLAVFAGGWTLEAADHVRQIGNLPNTVLDELTQLANKSLVLAEERDSTTRYRMLEPIRQYARGKLIEAGEEGSARDHHLDFFMKFAEVVEPKFRGPEQAAMSEQLETEHDNLRAALGWSLSNSAAEAGLRLAGVLGQFWLYRGYLTEGRRWLEYTLTIGKKTSAAIRAKALKWAGGITWRQNDIAAASLFYEESMAVNRELGDKQGIAQSLADLATVAALKEEYSSARSLLKESLAMMQELKDKKGIARVLNNLGMVALMQDDYTAARSLFEESLLVSQEIGDRYGIAIKLNNLGAVLRMQGDYTTAASLMRTSLTMKRELGDKYTIATSLGSLAGLGAVQGQAERAAQLLGAQEALLEVLGTQLVQPDQRRDHDRIVTTIRAQLDMATFAKAWAEGRTLTLEQAIAEAEQVTIPPHSPTPTQTPAPTYPADLTEREVAVLRLLARGLSNAEIAEQLVLSPRTVGAHLRSIFSKLDVTTRTAAARVAIDLKLV